MSTPQPLQQPPLDKQTQVQVERLIGEDASRHSPDEIERMAYQSAAELADAPVQQFVPNLVYNDVKSRLVEDDAEHGSTPA